MAGWQPGGGWEGLACIEAIWTEFERKNGKTGEWHSYSSSRNLTAEERLHHARMEWRVESMHWLLDVNLGEDACRILDGNVQQNLNMARKTALNLLGRHKKKTGSKQAITGIMMECLMRPQKMFDIVQAWIKEEPAQGGRRCPKTLVSDGRERENNENKPDERGLWNPLFSIPFYPLPGLSNGKQHCLKWSTSFFALLF